MDLLKKTLSLSGEREGTLSVVRVGRDVGIKIVGSYDEKMLAGVKLGERTVVFPLTGDKTEMEYADLDVRETDAIGCIVLAEDKIVSRGGVPVKPSEVRQKEKEPPVYSSAGEKEGEKEELFSRLSSSDGAPYYLGVREKLDELFIIHPSDEVLNAAFPHSEWIKIKYDGEDYYVVGRIREEGRVVFLGYGVPGKKSVPPPKVASFAHFLEVDLIGYDGYWLFFQDAVTGKTVKNAGDSNVKG